MKGAISSMFSKISETVKDSVAGEVFNKTIIHLKAIVTAADKLAAAKGLLTLKEIEENAKKFKDDAAGKVKHMRLVAGLVQGMILNDKDSASGKAAARLSSAKEALISVFNSSRDKVISGSKSVLDGPNDPNSIKGKVIDIFKKFTEKDPIPPEFGPDGQPLDDEQKKLWVTLEKEKIEHNRIVLETEGPESTNFLALAPPADEEKEKEHKKKSKSLLGMAARGIGKLFWKTITGGKFITKGSEFAAKVPFKLADKMLFGGKVGKTKDAIKSSLSKGWHKLTDPKAPDIDPSDTSDEALNAKWAHERAKERGIFGRSIDKVKDKMAARKAPESGIVEPGSDKDNEIKETFAKKREEAAKFNKDGKFNYKAKADSIFNKPKIEAPVNAEPVTTTSVPHKKGILGMLGGLATKGFGKLGKGIMGKIKGKNDPKYDHQAKADSVFNKPSIVAKPKPAEATEAKPAEEGVNPSFMKTENNTSSKINKLSKRKQKKLAQKEATQEKAKEREKKDFDAQKAKEDARHKEVEDEKADAKSRLAKKGEGGGGWLSSILGALGTLGSFLLGGFGKIITKGTVWLAGKIGGAILKLVPRLLGGLGRIILKIGGGAIGTVAKVGMMAASAAMPALATAASAVGAALLSPVGLVVGGVLLVAAVAYAGYMAYKYLTRNSAGLITRIRLMQYGLGEDQKDNYNLMFKLEAICQKFLTKSGDGFTIKPFDDEANRTVREDIFKLTNKDEDKPKVDILRKWLNARFIPIYQSHVNALEKAKSGTYFDKIEGLNSSEKIAYVKNSAPSASVYSVDEIPIVGYSKITVTQDQINKITENALASISAEPKKDNLPPPPPPPKPATDPTAVPKPTVEPANTKPPKPLIQASPDAEKAPGSVGTSTAEGSAPKPGAVPKADGPLRGGNSSMNGLSIPSNVDVKDIEPNMLNLLTGMADEFTGKTGKLIPITSGFRSEEKQKALYAKDPAHAAKPGHSLHEKGLAIDMDSKTANQLDKLGLMAKYGFTRPVGQEPWHVEPSGVSIDPAAALRNDNTKRDAVIGSPGRGGGGYGTLDSSIKVKRNKPYQLALYTSKTGTPVPEKVDGASASADAIKQAMNTTPTTTDKPVVPSSDKSDKTTTPTAGATPTPSNDAETVPSKATYSSDKSQVTVTASKNTNMDKYSPDMSVTDAIAKAASVTGVDKAMLMKFGQLESNFKANASNSKSSAGGTFQFIDTTWTAMLKKYGAKYNIPPGASKSNPYYSALMAAEYIKENLRYTANSAKAIGTDKMTTAYLGHVFGAGGANSLLKECYRNPDTPCDKVLSPRVISSNPALTKNKGIILSVKGVIQKITSKVGGTVNFNDSLGKGETEVAGTSESLSQKESVVSSGSSSSAGTPASAAVDAVTPSEQTYPLNKPTLSAKPSISIDRSSDSAAANPIASSQVEAIATKQLDILTQMLTALKSIDDKTGKTSQDPGSSSSPNKPVQKLQTSSVSGNRSTSAVNLARMA